jgi:hypothetical protein
MVRTAWRHAERDGNIHATNASINAVINAGIRSNKKV